MSLFLFLLFQLSIIIRDPVEKLNRSGINCLKYEQNANADRLFTAGRDSIIRVYTNLAHYAQEQQQHQQQQHFNSASAASLNDITISSNSSTPPLTSSDNLYQMSMSHHTDWVNDIIVCKRSKTGLYIIIFVSNRLVKCARRKFLHFNF